MAKIILKGRPTRERTAIVYGGPHHASRKFIDGAWVTFRVGVPIPVSSRWARALIGAKAGFTEFHGDPGDIDVTYALVRNMGLGDVIMAGTTARALGKTWPWAKVAFYTEARYLPVLRHQPDFEGRAMEDGTLHQQDVQFDICGISERASDRMDKERIEIYAQYCGVTLEDRQPRVYTTENEKLNGAQHLMERGWTGGPLLGIQPISSRPERNYSLAQLDAVAKFFYDSEGMQAAIFHNEPIDYHWSSPVIDMSAQTTVGPLLDCLANCTVFLGVDSGVTHAAAAQGIPTVAMTGPIAGRLRYACYPSATILERSELPCVARAHECYSCVRGEECLQFTPEQVITVVGSKI